jgi:hypothetical protein
MTPKRNVHWAVDYFVILLLQIASAIASLVLLSIGLAVIFGMMRVVNLAHGEFLMLGGYAAITAAGLRRPAPQAGDLHGRRRARRPVRPPVCQFGLRQMFSLPVSGQIIIWVIICGLGTLIGPIIGCIPKDPDQQSWHSHAGEGVRLDRPQSRLGAVVVVGAEGLTALTVRALRYLAGKRRGAAHEPTAQERTSRP